MGICLRMLNYESPIFCSPRIAASVCIVLLLTACSTTHFKDSADKEVYEIVKKRIPEVPGAPDAFTIETDAEINPLADLPYGDEAFPEAMVYDEDLENPPRRVGLNEALAIAVEQNRRYQSEKESLYLEALALTLDRHRYTPIFSGGLSAEYRRDTIDTVRDTRAGAGLAAARDVINGLDALTGNSNTLLRQYFDVVNDAVEVAQVPLTRNEITDRRSASGAVSFDVSRLMRGGGIVALGLTSNFFKFLKGDTLETSGTILDGSFVQPLWRGRGARVAAERLTQAERNFLYQFRDFTRFRKAFTVDVVSDYYNVLQTRDVVINNHRSYVAFERNTERERDFAEVGRSTVAQVGRQEQALLNAENRWTDALRSYHERLDEFKITLGVSTDENIMLDPAELDRLKDDGLNHPALAAEDATQVALRTRLDLYTAADRVADSERQVYVAANALRPGLDLFVQGRATSEGINNFDDLDFQRAQWSAGLDVDLPLDRKAERNAYRASLINEKKALRDFTLAEDNVKLQVRAVWRNLEQARRNYDIAVQSVKLNQNRVEEQELLAALGRGSVLDQVDAQNNLNQSENDLISALVRHTIARLQFWRDMGILYIDQHGQWEEVGYETVSGE